MILGVHSATFVKNWHEDVKPYIHLCKKAGYKSVEVSLLGQTSSSAKEIAKLANDLNYVKGKAKVFYLKGILENIKSDYDKSLFYFKKSLVNYEIINDKSGIASIYTSFGITYFDQSQYIDAIKTYQKASDIYKEIGNQSGLITCLINIGNAYSETGRYDDAISNYKKALDNYF